MESSNSVAVWHFSLDALPAVLAAADGTVQLHVIAGTYGGSDPRVSVEFRTRAPGGDWADRGTADAARVRPADHPPYRGDPTRPGPPGQRVDRRYLVTDWWAGRYAGNAYFEAALAGLEPGTEVAYRIRLDDEPRCGWYRVVAIRPAFTRADMAGGSMADGSPAGGPVWIGFVRRDAHFTHVRVDLDDIVLPEDSPEFPATGLRIGVNDAWYPVDVAGVAARTGEPSDAPLLPLIDFATDQVVLSVPGTDGPVQIALGDRIERIDDRRESGLTRVMFQFFAIQSMNDLLGDPFTRYSPPRTYMQISMRDDDGLFKSGPLAERPTVDGYAFGFDVFRRFAQPYEVAFNGGILTLIHHDCRPENGWAGIGLPQMAEDVRDGFLHPQLAGYGSFRVPYFPAEAVRRDVVACAELESRLLGRAGRTLYLDSRLYLQYNNADVIRDLDQVDYLVFDADTGYADNQDSIRRSANAGNKELGSFRLWKDTRTGKYVVFIDDDLKDNATPGNDYDWPKPPVGVRQRLMRFALDPKLRENNLLCYADDFEKACGNGWFEGGKTKEAFSAFLEWISAARPWLSVVTTADLDPEVDCMGEIDIRMSVDPKLDPGGMRSVDQQGYLDHFGNWVATWRAYPAAWAGSTLGELNKRVQDALLTWPAPYRDNPLYELAWLGFLMYQHEYSWNKAPESGDPNEAVRTPEDFTLVEGLQVRNTLVWLQAAVWAAGNFPDPASLAAEITRIGGDPDHWDADPLATPILCTDRVLLVLDCNGGVVTHAFVKRDGVARSVSGTYKSYQYERPDDQVACDGPVVQNTVWTPNHRYIGSTPGLPNGPADIRWPDDRPSSHGPETFLLPNNFDSYDADESVPGSVTFTYRPTGDVPGSTDPDEYLRLLRQDGQAHRDGRPDQAVVWHGHPAAFGKTYRLSGTTLTVTLTDVPDVPDGLVIDNEFCVDLLAGVRDGDLLTREVTPDGIVVRSGTGTAVRIGTPQGGAFSTGSEITSVAAAAADDKALPEFLSLHRVLTDAVRIVAHARTVSYQIELDF